MGKIGAASDNMTGQPPSATPYRFSRTLAAIPHLPAPVGACKLPACHYRAPECELAPAAAAFRMNQNAIAIGSDHAGFHYKEAIKVMLQSEGYEVRDYGTNSEAPCDYPDFIRPVAEAVARGEFARGIVLGGSGNGEAIVANRIRGVRCAIGWSEQTAVWGRAHNNANVLSIGERTVSKELALKIVKVWLATPFEGGRHLRRIQKIDGG